MGKRILVVDDEPVVLGAVCKVLKNTDYTVDTVERADEALEVFRSSPYDVVITDLMMPGIGGLELIRQLGALPSPPQIIVITGYPTIQTALKAKRFGAFEYVTKPFTRQELASVVVRALRRGSPQKDAPSGSPVAPGSTYYIPEHSWARMEQGDTVYIGMARAFASSIGHVEQLSLPACGDLLEQGRVCVVMRADDGIEHCLYSPLSGRVVELNESVSMDPELALLDPEGAGWLFGLAPHDPEQEIHNLAPAREGTDDRKS